MIVNLGLGVGSTYSGTAGSWSGSTYFSATGATSVVGTNGATFYITGVQLEVGSSATGFEYRQYQQELALCQRYYINGGYFLVLNQYYGTCCFPVTMRATPTITLSGGGTNAINTYGFSGSTGSPATVTWTSTAEL